MLKRMRSFSYAAKTFWRQFGKFCEETGSGADVAASVGEILSRVRVEGDTALVAYLKRFDKVTLTPTELRVGEEELQAARKSLTARQRRNVRKAIHCVEEFHRQALPKAWSARNPHGADVGEVFYPLERVGLYVPGGRVPLVSTVVMTATLARLARVPEIVAVTPPRPDGSINNGLLAALSLCGVKEVYRAGGPMAIAALAYGTGTIRRVDKIFGPGNVYVNEAKRQVVGTVGIDLLAGPSDVMIIADESARPAYVAADLLAQAEHDVRTRVFLVGTSADVIREVRQEVRAQVEMLPHRDAIREALGKGGATVEVADLEEAAVVANYVAPEHLELQVSRRDARVLTRKITRAGAIFEGHYTPTVLGDFTAGPSHTLPTGGTARFLSGLQISDFFRRSSVVRYGKRSLHQAAETVAVFSELEELEAHGRSLQVRFEL